jgi:hypothetical protein
VVALEEQRHDLDQAADADDEQDQHDHQAVVLLDSRVVFIHVPPFRRRQACAARGGMTGRFDRLAAAPCFQCCRP